MLGLLESEVLDRNFQMTQNGIKVDEFSGTLFGKTMITAHFPYFNKTSTFNNTLKNKTKF